MLSKKQFNAATERLQNILTTSDLLEMLRHRLTRENKDNQYTDVISHLEAIPNKFSDKTPLDRRRAENYLANTLYGKNHSQIAHLIKGHHEVKDHEFGKRAEMYGKFISNYGSDLSYGDCELVDAHAKALAKRLRATSPDDFKISYQGYRSDADKFDYITQSNVLMYVSFLNLNIQVEFVFLRDDSPEGDEPLEESFISITVNGMTLEEYGRVIGCQYLGEEDDYASLWSLEVLFSSVAYSMVCDGLPSDFYCLDIPKKLLQAHQWKLNLDRRYIADQVIKDKLLYPIESAIVDRSDGRYAKEIEKSVKGMSKFRKTRSKYDDDVLTLKGFTHVKTSPIISGELLFTLSNTTSISICFSYHNEYGTAEIIQLEVKHNDNFIESCTDSAELDNFEYPWHSVVYNLKDSIPYINALVSDHKTVDSVS